MAAASSRSTRHPNTASSSTTKPNILPKPVHPFGRRGKVGDQIKVALSLAPLFPHPAPKQLEPAYSVLVAQAYEFGVVPFDERQRAHDCDECTRYRCRLSVTPMGAGPRSFARWLNRDMPLRGPTATKSSERNALPSQTP